MLDPLVLVLIRVVRARDRNIFNGNRLDSTCANVLRYFIIVDWCLEKDSLSVISMSTCAIIAILNLNVIIILVNKFLDGKFYSSVLFCRRSWLIVG